MRIYNANWLKWSVAEKLLKSSMLGEFNGMMTSGAAYYLESCKAFHAASGTLLIYTRDTGHHTSGWFKNPEFERCLHLSMSFREPFDMRKPRQHDWTLAAEWCELFFGESKRMAWQEGPKSDVGINLEVEHWRVFCNENWQPIHPKGEVYSLEFTKKGWKSWSELHPNLPEPSSLHAG
jgi:hypothetical protein